MSLKRSRRRWRQEFEAREEIRVIDGKTRSCIYDLPSKGASIADLSVEDPRTPWCQRTYCTRSFSQPHLLHALRLTTGTTNSVHSTADPGNPFTGRSGNEWPHLRALNYVDEQVIGTIRKVFVATASRQRKRLTGIGLKAPKA